MTRPPSSCEVEFGDRTPAAGGNTAAAYSGTPTFRRGFRAHGDGPPNREKHIMKHPVGLAPPAGGRGPTFSIFPWNCRPETFGTRPPTVSSIDSSPPSPPPTRRVDSISSTTDPSVSPGAAVEIAAPVIVQAARYSSSVMPARSNADASSAGSSVRACPVQSSQPLIGAARSCGVGRPRPSRRCRVIPAR